MQLSVYGWRSIPNLLTAGFDKCQPTVIQWQSRCRGLSAASNLQSVIGSSINPESRSDCCHLRLDNRQSFIAGCVENQYTWSSPKLATRCSVCQTRVQCWIDADNKYLENGMSYKKRRYCLQRQSIILHCVSKNIPDVFNSRNHWQIFIIFGRNVTEKASNHTLLYFPTSPN